MLVFSNQWDPPFLFLRSKYWSKLNHRIAHASPPLYAHIYANNTCALFNLFVFMHIEIFWEINELVYLDYLIVYIVTNYKTKKYKS